MGAYIARRLLLIIPTIFGIMLLTFSVAQVAPGGPIEQIIAQLSGQGGDGTERISGGGSDFNDTSQSDQISSSGGSSKYRGAQGLDPEFIKKMEKQFGFDKPAYVRFFKMLLDYTCRNPRIEWTNFSSLGPNFSLPIPKMTCFNFGESYYRSISVLDLIKEKMPVSVSLGIWVTLLAYTISIPLGIRKAVKDGSRFDVWTSLVITIAYAVPGFMFGIFTMIVFAGGSFFDWFPLRGLVSDNFAELTWYEQIIDYFWHLTLPLLALLLSTFATTTLLTKNSFLDEIRKQYVTTARAKGLSESKVLYGHVFRNAMLIIIAGFPAAFIGSFFSGSLLIESLFSLDGLGLLAFTSLLTRDYPVVFATLFIFSLLGLVINLLSDIIYTKIDPRIDFEKRDV